jgi:hypothetical protein
MAIERKMLELAYILLKKTEYNFKYEMEKRAVVDNILSSETGV